MDSGPPAIAASQSPCNKICTIDAASGLCIGCFRTMDEVAIWSRLSADTRRQIMQTLPQRESKIAPDKRYR